MSGDSEHKHALPQGSVRGRGAGINPGNRFDSLRLHILGEHLDQAARDHPSGVQVPTRIAIDDSQSIINRVDSPDLNLHWTLNPYRGCEHGCIYCYARPTHEYLGLSSGLDFETRIIAKPEAPSLLRKWIENPKWCGEPIMLSGVTDPYQPIESRLELTRACLKVFLETRQPVTLITKNKLILRDLDLLTDLHARKLVHIALTITSLDHSLASIMEPRASSPRARLDAVSTLSSIGIPVSVMVAPVIPAINDHEVPAILKAASEAGASRAGYVLLRLPHQIKDLFLEWLQRHFPDRAAKVESFIRESRGGALYRSAFFERQRGTGPRARQIQETFTLFARRYKLDRSIPPLAPRTPPPPPPPPQLSLFNP